ncbi:alpha-(1-_3)-arabinofuranosyltransferase family protein [Janibacter sp. Y6]|uniref:alpha-(1->3)-arabinofuranosyltransferase domain-containing protein n=1 Tax=Janibacter sp. Y6 TaxID=2913552 RepID=UPI0034A2924F
MTDGGDSPRVVRAARLAAGVLVLAALSFHQAPGLVVPDTKLDLTVDPMRFLGRALHLWDPAGSFGQLQNQAYGYLLPAGPFHALLLSAGLPAWVVQRLWWTLLLSVALVGMWRLLGHLGVGSPWARYAAAMAFALSPRLISETAITSVEVWPMALAPWVLLPLVDPRPRSTAWRATRSGCAVALVGGVNAVATGAVLVLPVLWILTRAPWRESVRLLLAWLGAVALAVSWWLLPLLALGRYSPPFLDWIEDAPVTTAFASVLDAVKGTTAWVGYLATGGGPSWPAQWSHLTVPALMIIGIAVSGLGLGGLRLVREELRLFLVLGLLAGLLLVTAGHLGAAGSPVAGSLRELLDGPLAPLRNTHKFELVVRVVLTVGLAQALTSLARLSRRLGLARPLVPAVTVCLLVGLSSPALAGSMPRPEGYEAIPQHWRDVARFLDDDPAPGTALVVPGASFADFTWGSTKDEPLQALTSRPFAVRDAVPLGGAGSTRLLDDIEGRLADGRGGPELVSALRSAGVRFLVVRNDLRPDAASRRLLPLHQALADSGLTPARSFGPRVGTGGLGPSEQDWRTRLPYRSVEIFEIGGAASATQVPLASALRAPGAGPEDVPDIRGAFGADRPIITGSDAESAGLRELPGVVVDGNLRREHGFGRSVDPLSAVMASDDRPSSGRRSWQLISDDGAARTVRGWSRDVASVRASSSASDADAQLRLGPGNGPAAAFDGDPSTRWVSGALGRGPGEWLEVRLRTARDLDGLRVLFDGSSPVGAMPERVRVSTDRGSSTSVVDASTGVVDLAVPPGAARWVRVEVVGVAGGEVVNGVAIAELQLPGVDTRSHLDVPEVPGPVSGVLLRRASDGRSDCLRAGDRPLCAPFYRRDAESEAGLRREVDMERSTYEMSGRVVPRPGPALDRLIAAEGRSVVTSSSSATQSPAGSAPVLLDGDLGTGWQADVDDGEPTVRVELPRAVRTDGLQLRSDAYLGASRPREVRVRIDGGRAVDLAVAADGRVDLGSERRIRRMSLRFLEWDEERTQVDRRFSEVLPVGFSELVLDGVEVPAAIGPRAARTGAACGFGPELRVGSTTYTTRVVGTIGDLLDEQELRWELCGSRAADGVTMPGGPTTVEAGASAEFEPTQLRLGSPGRDPSAGERQLARPNPARAEVRTTASDVPTLVTIAQNHNAGWVATDAEGVSLEPVRVDGWKQGWVLPAGGSGPVSAVFEPDAPYRSSLAIGGLLVLVLIAGALVSGRHPARQLAARRVPGPVGVVLATGALALLAGPLGAVVAVAAAVAARLGRSVVAAMALVCVLGSAVLVLPLRWPEGDAGVGSLWVQGLVVLAVALVVTPAVTSASGRYRSRLRPRLTRGRSTHR